MDFIVNKITIANGIINFYEIPIQLTKITQIKTNENEGMPIKYSINSNKVQGLISE